MVFRRMDKRSNKFNGIFGFLRTPYWNAISLYAKSKANFSCQLCNSKENLRTHHRTYERHGYEHRDEVIKQDLIVLCDDCHSKFHDICEN